MARSFEIGDKVVPSPKKMVHSMQKVIGGEVGTIIRVEYSTLRVQYSFGVVTGYRDEFNRHSSSFGNLEHSGSALGLRRK